jgi:hypothetical protein
VEHWAPQVVPDLNKKEQVAECPVAYLVPQVKHQVPQVVPDLNKKEQVVECLVTLKGYPNETPSSISSSLSE